MAGESDEVKLRRPYDGTGSSLAPLRAVDDIIEWDKALREVTEGLSRPVRLGSIMRLPESALLHWGVQVDDSNRSELSLLSDRFYLMDADEGREGRLERDELHWLKKRATGYQMDSMAEMISRLVKEIALTLDDGKREFRIANIASGAGKLCSAIAAALQEEPATEAILPRTEFHLVDNHEKNALAELNLKGFGAKVVPHAMIDDQFLGEGPKGFDFIVALSHFHRKPFLGSYLSKMHSSLSEGGLLISGDFHSRLCHHPQYVYELLDRMGLDPARLNMFDELMGPLMSPPDQRVSRIEKGALEEHVNYWTRLDWSIGGANYRGNTKVRILGAFLSCRQLEEMLREKGFETEVESIRREFPNARLPFKLPVQVNEKSDSAAVTVALKRRAGG